MTRSEWSTTPLPEVKSKAALVYENLHAAIADGDLKPGERVNMDELARRLGVSKIPIREAVKRLESEGLLVSRVHSGVVVAEVDKTEMRGVFLAREAIEGLVGTLAAANVDDRLLADLRVTQSDMRKALKAGTVKRLPELNSVFHRRLAEASGYRILGELTEQLLLTVRRYRMVTPSDASSWQSVIDEHDQIIDALTGGDPETVATAMASHVSSQANLNTKAE